MTGYNKAIHILEQASTNFGFVAAVNEEDNYRRVWTRDSALCGLAALCTDQDALKLTYKTSIETIFKFQHRDGFIPGNVSPDASHVSYGSVVGRVDNHAWIIISACTYAMAQNDQEWLMQYKSAIQKSFRLMTAWEFNGRGLMYVPQSADWADEYYHHGYILYNQLLRLWALRSAAKAFDDPGYLNQAKELNGVIEKYYSGKEFYAVQIERMWAKHEFPFWVMGFNTSALYTQFDMQANALALLLKIGDHASENKLVSYIEKLLLLNDGMMPSYYPVITNEDVYMHDLKNNHAYRFRNLPHEFHNGGLWPVWNGFLSAILSLNYPGIAANINERIEKTCMQNDWEFNECYHGQTNMPVGVSKCAWSAAGYILGNAGNLLAILNNV